MKVMGHPWKGGKSTLRFATPLPRSTDCCGSSTNPVMTTFIQESFSARSRCRRQSERQCWLLSDVRAWIARGRGPYRTAWMLRGPCSDWAACRNRRNAPPTRMEVRTRSQMPHEQIKRKLIVAGRVLVAQCQDDFTRGHISVRLPDDPSRFF